MTASTDSPKVIYVMGAGRSGSTTLGITLGNCANVFYAGELDNWLVQVGRCRRWKTAERARFWSSVRDRLEDPAAARSCSVDEAQRAIERSLSLFRVHHVAEPATGCAGATARSPRISIAP